MSSERGLVAAFAIAVIAYYLGYRRGEAESKRLREDLAKEAMK